jgi:membrane peptidoglycan carboxypeptidase
MASRRTDRLGFGSVLSHLAVMVAVAAVMGVLAAGLAIPFAGVVGLGARTVAKTMDHLPAKLTTAPLAQRSRMLDANGKVIATFYDQNRVNVTLAQVAPIMRKAIVSIEDYRFYQHGAIDLKGTLRAFVENQASGGVVQGGSSITQQMVKLTLVNQAKTKAQYQAATADTYQRKLLELRYAVAFERKYSKNWILQRYLNLAYFGDGAYGIEAAARHYFSKHASQLNLKEAALLAGLVQNPTNYDPTTNPEVARQRRNTVLARMAQLQVVPPDTAKNAEHSSLGLNVTPARNGCISSVAPWFCDYARAYLLADPAMGKTPQARLQKINGGGLTIKTTLKPRIEKAATRAVRNHVDPTDHAIGALAMVQPGTGNVRALAQSRPMGAEKRKGQTFLNYVVPKKYGDANGFQAGSTFKAFVLSSAIDQGIPLDTTINAPQTVSIPVSNYARCDGPINSGSIWTVNNSTGAGTFNLYTGTQLSVNTFFAQLEERTGLCEPVHLARQMGLVVPDSQIYPPFTLGITDTNPLSMAAAYATFPARGEYCNPRPVTQVVDSTGKVIMNYPEQCHRVLGKDVADAVNSVLRGVQQPGGFGYDVGINLNQPSAGKTGTSENNRSVWFIGYTPNMAAAAMLAGVNSAGHWQSLNGMTIGGQYVAQAHGSSNAGPIWGDAMKAIEQMLPNERFHRPNPRTIKGQMITLPTVAGQSPQKAADILRRAGFNPVIGPSVNSSYTAGTVAYTDPAEGSELGTGSTVTIYVSNGIPVAPPPPPPSPAPPSTTHSPSPQPPSPSGGGENGNGNGNGNGKPKH